VGALSVENGAFKIRHFAIGLPSPFMALFGLADPCDERRLSGERRK
jgi:hypothetical protein